MPSTSGGRGRRRAKARASVVAGSMLLSAWAAVGCSSSGGAALKGDPTTLVRSAADRTEAAGTAQVSISMGVAVGPGLIGTGVADLAGGRADLTFLRTGAQARSRDRFRLLVDGANGYLSGVTSGWLGGGLPDVAAAARERATPLDDLLMRPGAGLALAFLRGARDVLPYGGEEVEGTSTLRYSFVVDLAAAIAASPAARRPALQAAARAVGDVLEPADVWLDRAGRVRRLQWALNPRLHTTTTKGSLFTEDGEYIAFIDLDLSHFGTPAPVQLPDPTTVTAVPTEA